MHLASTGLLPYTQSGGLTAPAADPEMVFAAPGGDSPDRASRLTEFIRATVAEAWSGSPVQFFSGVDVDVWGLPTSAPAADPNNPQFIYQRFQNGVLQYDATNQTTQGLLLGEYLKSLLTGQNIPGDLEAEAVESPLMRQYDPGHQNALARPSSVPFSNLTNAFVPDAQ
jgi:hypothetical protein